MGLRMLAPQGLPDITADKCFVVLLRDGSVESLQAESGAEDDEAHGYVFFVRGTEIVALFAKETVVSWREKNVEDTPPRSAVK